MKLQDINQDGKLALLGRVKEKAGLTDEELDQVRAVTINKHLRKRQYLLQEGDICHYNCFVAKGCIRNYRVSEDGVEHILRFAVENWWLSDTESYNNGTRTKNNIDALEDSDLLLIGLKKKISTGLLTLLLHLGNS